MARRLPLRFLVLLALAIGAATVFWFASRPAPLLVQGEVDATRVDLAARVTGRVADLAVDVGDQAKAGETLVALSSPQLLANLAAAEAAYVVAKKDRDRVYSTRAEVIEARRAELESTEADVTLYKLEFDRQHKLLTTGNTPQQRVDEATNNLTASIKAREAAKANLQLAEKGSSDEEKALSDADVKRSEAAVKQIEADIAELTVEAPIDGEVTTRVAELGELFNPGAPLVSIVDLNDIWFVFNLREDLLNGLKVGDQFHVSLPAMGGRDVVVHVTAINAEGQYANWRATKATGDFDLRTFEVRAKPIEPVDGLRPGMSAIVAWKAAPAPRVPSQ